MKMQQATEKEFDKLYGIIAECSEWLKSKGIDQWDPPYPSYRFRLEIEKGEVYFFSMGNYIVGTVTLLRNKPDYYPPDLWNDDNAWYVCRLAVPRRFSGKDIGTKILHAAETEAGKNGIKYLRLEVVKANGFLADYYEKNGFERVREGKSHGTASIFMEKTV